MGKKNRSRIARRTGSPIGEPEDVSRDSENSGEAYEVECIVGHRVRHGITEYRVRWSGWSQEYDEWLDQSKMNCPDAINDYWESQKNSGAKRQRLESSGGKTSPKHNVVTSSMFENKDVSSVVSTGCSAAVSSQLTVTTINRNECTASVDSPVERIASTMEVLSTNDAEEVGQTSMDVSTSRCCSIAKQVQSASQKPFVTPHGFERGLIIERIHGFIRRADHIFAIVEFKNCNTIEFLSTRIVEHYDPLALIRGFEEHYIRCRRNTRLQQSKVSQNKNPVLFA